MLTQLLPVFYHVYRVVWQEHSNKIKLVGLGVYYIYNYIINNYVCINILEYMKISFWAKLDGMS